TTDVDCDSAAREATFRFDRQGLVEVTFHLDVAEADRVAMTCIRESNNADWLGTKLSFALVPAGDATRVELVHAGYPATNDHYDLCVKGWAYFLGSLKRYVETGTGEPHRRPTREIVDHVEIAAAPAKVLAALTTADGIRAWWTKDC